MTDRAASPITLGADSNRLAYSGRALQPSLQARATRRWGWWLYAEYRLMNMRAYLQTILIRSIGLPLLYLSSMGLGLGNLVDAGAGDIVHTPSVSTIPANFLRASLDAAGIDPDADPGRGAPGPPRHSGRADGAGDDEPDARAGVRAAVRPERSLRRSNRG